MSRRRLVLVASTLFLLPLIAILVAAPQRRAPVVRQPASTPVLHLPTGIESAPSPGRSRLPFPAVPDTAIAPVVVERSPARGEELAPAAPIKLIFDRAMDQSTVAAAFAVSPKVAGSLEWPDLRTVQFRPAAPWKRSAVYDVTLGQSAKAQDGAALSAAYPSALPRPAILRSLR